MIQEGNIRIPDQDAFDQIFIVIFKDKSIAKDSAVIGISFAKPVTHVEKVCVLGHGDIDELIYRGLNDALQQWRVFGGVFIKNIVKLKLPEVVAEHLFHAVMENNFIIQKIEDVKALYLIFELLLFA